MHVLVPPPAHLHLALQHHLLLHTPDVVVQEAQESKLRQGEEDRDEADDDEDIEGGGVGHLGLRLSAEADSDDGESACGPQAGPGGVLLAEVRLDQPEGHPGAHHDDGERDVDLEDVEAQGPVELEAEVDDGVVAVLHGGEGGPVAPVGHRVLGQVKCLHRQRAGGPAVADVLLRVAEASDLEGTDLAREGWGAGAGGGARSRGPVLSE